MWIHKAVCDTCWGDGGPKSKETKAKVAYVDKEDKRRHACAKHGEALEEAGVETRAERHGVKVID